MNSWLTQDPDEGEVKGALFSFSSEKSSGPDSFSAEFFKILWTEIKEIIIVNVKQLFRGKLLIRAINHTFMIYHPNPENADASEFSDFRPTARVKMMEVRIG